MQPAQVSILKVFRKRDKVLDHIDSSEFRISHIGVLSEKRDRILLETSETARLGHELKT